MYTPTGPTFKPWDEMNCTERWSTLQYYKQRSNEGVNGPFYLAILIIFIFLVVLLGYYLDVREEREEKAKKEAEMEMKLERDWPVLEVGRSVDVDV